MDKLGTPRSNEWRIPREIENELSTALRVNNPCNHSGFESYVCEICGYPDSRKMIATLTQQVKELEARCEQRTKAAANTLAINSQLRDKIKDLEAQVEVVSANWALELTHSRELDATNAKYKSAIQGMLRIEDLWLPLTADEEHKGEAIALHQARNIMLEALKEDRDGYA